MKSNKLFPMLVGLVFITAALPVATSLQAERTMTTPNPVDTGWTIDVYTDQEYYYPGETVQIWGWIKFNGTGVKKLYCLDVYDANETFPPWWGICSQSNDTGYFMASPPPLPEHPKGTWRIHVTIYEPFAEQNKTFELVGTEIIADANGPYEGVQGEEVQFTGSASGGKPIYTWLWDFGDGETSTDQNPIHIYDAPGTYDVRLTAKDLGNHTGNDTTTATIDPAPVSLNITAITGGLGISATIANEGATDASDINWSISCEGGLIILPLGGIKEGATDEIAAGEDASISTFAFGIGKTKLMVLAENPQSSAHACATAFILGPFVLNVQSTHCNQTIAFL